MLYTPFWYNIYIPFYTHYYFLKKRNKTLNSFTEQYKFYTVTQKSDEGPMSQSHMHILYWTQL
jgi:uncharacterized membrane protein YoaT (DUF817 family)